MNDLPTSEIPPNVVHLQRTTDGLPIPADAKETSMKDFCFYITPFQQTLTRKLQVTCNSPTFGLNLSEDETNGRVFLEDINKNSSASKLFSSHKATRNKIRGAFIVSINGTQVFNKSSAITLLADLHSQGIKTFDIQFAPEHKMSSQQQWKQLDEFNLFAPDPTTENTAQIDLNAIRAIASIRTRYDSYD